MARLPIINNLRVVPRESDFLDRKLGLRGEIFFDNENNTLRLYNAADVGGIALVKEDLSNVTNAVFLAKATAAGVGGGGSGSIEVSDTAPVSPDAGTIWFNSTNARLYVYVNDGNSSQWVQPAVPQQTIPSSITDLGITDGSAGQYLRTDGLGNFTFADVVGGGGGGVDLTAFSVGVDATASGSGSLAYDNTTGVFTYTPPDLSSYATTTALNTAVTNSSNWNTAYGWGNHATQGYLTAEADTLDTITSRGATTTNSLTVGSITTSDLADTGLGATTIDSASSLTITTVDGTIIDGGPFRLPSLTDTERNALTAANGDMIYNTTSNKIEAYQNGSWIELDTGAAA